MTNQELKAKLAKIASECEVLCFRVGEILGEIEAEEEQKKTIKAEFLHS